MIENHEGPDINTWNLNQLAKTISQTSTDHERFLKTIQEAYTWAEHFDEKVDKSILKRCVKGSLQTAMIAAKQTSIDLATAVSAILTPPFLAGLIDSQSIATQFCIKTVAILKALVSLKHHQYANDGIDKYPYYLEKNCPHILAILLHTCDMVRVHFSGLPLDNLDAGLVHYNTDLLFELKHFYIPLSHRMRLYDIQSKLADFWLKYTDTLNYYAITAKLGMNKMKRQQKLNIIAEEVQAALQARGIDFTIKKRIKSVYSIWRKIQKIKTDFDQIHDLTAIRIILTNMDGKTLQEEKIACWQLLTIISNLYKPIGSIMRDWISTPRNNGYESLHLTFETYRYGQLEVQIRTERMDYIAEYGQAAHWKYKLSDQA